MKEWMKKNIGSLVFGVFCLVLTFSTSAKALLIRGMMNVGLMPTQIDKGLNEPLNVPSVRFLDVKRNQIVDIKDLDGKVVFINFWATWCPPCLAEMPSVNKLYLKYKDNPNIVFLIVESDANAQGGLEVYKKNNYELPLMVPKSGIPEQLLGGSIPTTVVLNKKGKIVFRHEGIADYNRKKFINFIDRKINE